MSQATTATAPRPRLWSRFLQAHPACDGCQSHNHALTLVWSHDRRRLLNVCGQVCARVADQEPPPEEECEECHLPVESGDEDRCRCAERDQRRAQSHYRRQLGV